MFFKKKSLYMYIKVKWCLVKKILKYKIVLKYEINEVLIIFNFYKYVGFISMV